eukprot:1197776-Amphidinium_carterae.1
MRVAIWTSVEIPVSLLDKGSGPRCDNSGLWTGMLMIPWLLGHVCTIVWTVLTLFLSALQSCIAMLPGWGATWAAWCSAWPVLVQIARQNHNRDDAQLQCYASELG